MSNHPFNLALRFLLELAGLCIIATWAWVFHQGIYQWLAVILYPTVAAAAWAIFRVASESGRTLVPVSGITRLLIEILFFSTATRMLYQLDAGRLYSFFLLLVMVHYAVSYDRILRLIRNNQN
ncbi:MAG: YrdB family protein [Bacteroidota bacterium]|nr:YrdB family protein [Bacteroidota bacterium]